MLSLQKVIGPHDVVIINQILMILMMIFLCIGQENVLNPPPPTTINLDVMGQLDLGLVDVGRFDI